MKVDYKKLEELRGKTKLTLLDWITIKILRYYQNICKIPKWNIVKCN